MTNFAEQSPLVRRLTAAPTRPRASEYDFGLISLVLLVVLAISMALVFSSADWPVSDFVVGP